MTNTGERWEQIPRLELAHLPTPLAPARRLGAALGLKQLWIKQDDLTGIGPGGNKARKLEYLLAAAQAEGADTVVTVGAAQSNHASSSASRLPSVTVSESARTTRAPALHGRKIWNTDMSNERDAVATSVSSAERPGWTRAACSRFTTPACGTWTPFGLPVDPEV